MGELSAEWWQQVPYHKEVGIILFTVLPVWACGAIIGLLVRLKSEPPVVTELARAAEPKPACWTCRFAWLLPAICLPC